MAERIAAREGFRVEVLNRTKDGRRFWADLDVRPEETRFLEMLAEALEIDMLTKSAIERGIRARNQVL